MTMGLLKSVNNVPGIDYYEYREIDYWSKFKYRTRVKIKGARLLYYVKNINEFIKKVHSGGWKYNPINDSTKVKILSNQHVFEKIISLRDELKKSKKGTVRIENETIAFFSNDLDKLTEIKQWDSALQVDCTEVQTGMYAGVKYFVREPKSKYRVYFRSKRVEETVLTDLKEFFDRNKNLKPSNALKIWIGSLQNRRYAYRSRYCSSAYYIDYNDESSLSLLALMHGDLIGRRYKLEKRES
jgi:hypothetical protein